MTYRGIRLSEVLGACKKPSFTFATGFSGGGGADIGLMLAGGRHVFGIEIEAEAVRSFKTNFPNAAIYHGDFRDVSNSSDLTEQLLQRGDLAVGDFDLLHMSPPCNEFSTLGPGRREGGSAGLVYDSINLALRARPRIVTIENVPNLCSGENRDFLHGALDELCVPLGNRAYFAAYRVLDASRLGVPQRRKRLFVVAIRADVAEACGISGDIQVGAVFPTEDRAEITLEEALAGLHQTEADLHPFRRAMMVSNFGRFARMLPHDPHRCMTPQKCGLGVRRFSAKRASLGLPCPTITASGQAPDGRSGILHPLENRKLSLPEMIRLSSWPDDYRLTGTIAQGATRLGMSVPPLLMCAIGQALAEKVLRRIGRGG